MMKVELKQLCAALLVLITCHMSLVTCGAGNAIIVLTDFQSNPLPGEQAVLTFLSAPQSQYSGTAVSWRNMFTADGTGTINLTNAAPGKWQVTPVDDNAVSFTFNMPVTNGTIYVQYWTTAAAGNTLPPGTMSYDVNASDLKYLQAAGTISNAFAVVGPQAPVLKTAVTNTQTGVTLEGAFSDQFGVFPASSSIVVNGTTGITLGLVANLGNASTLPPAMNDPIGYEPLLTGTGGSFFDTAGSFAGMANGVFQATTGSFGSISGSGTGITALNASQLTSGTVPLATLQNAVTNSIFPNGVTDSTAALQALCNVPNSTVILWPGDYYATQVYITNGVTIQANHSVIHQITAAGISNTIPGGDWIDWTNWNALVNCYSNKNISVLNLTMDGQKGVNYEAAGWVPYTGPNNAFYSLAAFGTNNIGMLWNSSGGGTISGCVAENFAGFGFFGYSCYDQLSYLAPRTVFTGNRAYTNACALYMQSWGGSHPELYGNAEYGEVFDFAANNCGEGIDDGVSNSKEGSLVINFCNMGINVSAGNGNSGPHKTIENVNLNHNVTGFFIASCDYLACVNWYEAATTTNYIVNACVKMTACAVGGIFNDHEGLLRQPSVFTGCDIGGMLCNGGTNDFESCHIYTANPIWVTNSIVGDYNCFSDSFANWNTDVFTNLSNSGTVTSSGYHITGRGVFLITTNFFVQQPTNFNVITTAATNSALVVSNLDAGRWIFSYEVTMQQILGGGSFYEDQVIFDQNIAVLGGDMWGDVQGGGGRQAVPTVPSTSTASLHSQIAGNGSGLGYMGGHDICVTSSVPFSIIVQINNQSLGTNQILANGSWITGRRIN